MVRTGLSRRTRVTHRSLAALVALFWCASPVLAALHAHAEAHRWCAEHGVLEETAELGRDGRLQTDGVPAAQGDPEPSAHGACPFARLCRYGHLLGPPVPPAPVALASVPVSPPGSDQPIAALAVLAIAPKTSPPA